MKEEIYKIKSKIVVYPGMGGWRFLVLPQKDAKEIKEKYGKYTKGWGSLPVHITIGKSQWETSIFPDKKLGTYLLPLKAKIRKAEGITDKTNVQFNLKINTARDGKANW